MLPPLLPVAPLLALLAIAGQPAERPRVGATRTLEHITLDGHLSEPAWKTADPASSFTQSYPDEGAPPTERTEFRVLYDQDALYVGILCEQVRSPIMFRLTRRDRDVAADGIWFDIDSRRDGVSAFHFNVNAAGVLGDGIHFNDTDFSRDWDENWDARVAVLPNGYSIEARIPFRVLRFDPVAIQDWGFQIKRFIYARQETDVWAYSPRSVAGVVSTFGTLTGLVGLRPGRPFQLRPFLLGRVRNRSPSFNPDVLESGRDMRFSVGLDAKIQPTNALALDLAINPDFGQVEVDQVILNLSTFEVVFPEKRAFFLEGIDVFSTPRSLLYTRRIGSQPASPTLGEDETLVDVPEPSRIYGAAKLVGSLGRRLRVGALTALTGEDHARVQAQDGTRFGRLVAPATLYNVLRFRALVAPNTEVGVLGTATKRFDSIGTICPDQTAPAVTPTRCFNDAYAGGLDGRWRSPSGAYVITGQALGAVLLDGPERPRRDGLPIIPGQPSAGGSLTVAKQGGPHWLWTVAQQVSGKRLDYNDLGYLDRKNDYNIAADLAYRTLQPWRRTIETRTTLSASRRQTLEGLHLGTNLQLGSWATFSSFWTIGVSAHYRPAFYDDRETGDGTALQRASRFGGDLWIQSDQRRRVAASLYLQGQKISRGERYGASGTLTARILPQFELELSPAVMFQNGEPRYVASETFTGPGTPPTVAYTFGAQRATTFGTTLRASYTFTPRLSLQTYAQVFLVALDYRDFTTATAPAGARWRIALSGLAAGEPPVSNPDTQQATLNLNAVLRWEYRLGSTLFLVYTRSQTPALTVPAGAVPRLRPGALVGGQAAADVIMLKLSYWWG